MSQDTVIDFLESYFQDDLTPDLVASIASNKRTFDRNVLASSYSAWRQACSVPVKGTKEYERHVLLGGIRPLLPERTPPQKKLEELRPYLPVRPGSTSRQPNIGYFVFDSSDQELWRTVDAIKHRLLYCHSLAVENPMAIWMAEAGGNAMLMNAMGAQRGVFGWRLNSRSMMRQWLAFLTHMKPLVRAGALVIVEAPARNPVLFSGRDLERAAAAAAELELGDYLGANRDLSLTVQLRARAPGCCDFDLSNPSVSRLAGNIVGLRETQGPLKARESELLGTFLKVDLPGISELTIKNLVAVRKNAAEFDRWRKGLEDITRRLLLERLDDLPPEDRAYELSRRFRAEVVELQERLGAQVNDSSTWGRVKPKAVTFMVGTAAAALVSPPLGLAVAGSEIARDFAKAITEALVDKDSGSSRKARQALAGLFVILQEPPT